MNAHEVHKLAKEQEDRFLCSLVSALLTYWNALLTGNGLLLATLSILVTLSGPSLALWQTRLIVFALTLNLLAILGLLWCFKSERDHYLDRLRAGPEPPPTDEEMFSIIAKEKACILLRRKLRKVFEIFAVVTIIVSVFLIIVIALCA